MKYFFTTLVLIATLCGVSMVHAQTTQTVACSPINKDNYDTCCGFNGTGGPDACFAFQNQQQIKNIQGQTGTTMSLPADVLSTTPELPYYSTNQIVIPSDSNSSSCKVIKFDSILGIINWIKCYIVTAIIPIIFGLTFVVFMWGIVKFMRSSEKKDKDEGKQYITAGLIGLFVMASVWGIVGVLTKTFGFSSTVPVLQTQKVTQ